MTVFHVHHRTTYRYSDAVSFGVHRWMFRPRDSQEQRLLFAQRQIAPAPSELRWMHDVFGNEIAVVSFDATSNELSFESEITVEHTPNERDFKIDSAAKSWPFEYVPDERLDLGAYLYSQYPDSALSDFAAKVASGQKDTARLLKTLARSVRETARYERRTTTGTQSPALTLERRSGTCRDFALLMIEAARVLGFAARFVTGYLYVPARDAGTIVGGGATHAWVQVFLPGAGWVEFDPTNGIVGSKDLIRVGVARDPKQAKPLFGTFEGGGAKFLGMDVLVKVTKQGINTTQPDRSASGAAVTFRG